MREVLGTGGYAVVYRAFDRFLKREVALKVLRRDRLSPGALLRLRREAAIARDVVHPRIVRVFDIEEAGETVFLTMEIVEGGSLGDRLTRHSLGESGGDRRRRRRGRRRRSKDSPPCMRWASCIATSSRATSS